MHCSSIDARISSNKKNCRAKLQQETHYSQDIGKHSSMDPQRPTLQSRLGRSRPGAGEFCFSAEGTDMMVVVSQLPWALRIRLGPQEAQCVLLTTEPSLQP